MTNQNPLAAYWTESCSSVISTGLLVLARMDIQGLALDVLPRITLLLFKYTSAKMPGPTSA
jgi:hypothetical protein